MKKQTLLIVVMGLNAIVGFAQNEYYIGMPVQPKCPCSINPLYKDRQRDAPQIPYSLAAKCPHIPTTYVPSKAPEGFYLFKRRKKKGNPFIPTRQE